MDRRVALTLSILLDGWREDHRVRDLAAAVNLTPSRLQHLFKASTQSSISEVVMRRRLEEAARLFLATYDRISEIVYYVGFRDVANFNHAFRRRYGMSPREYRRRGAVFEGNKAASTKS